MVKYTQAQKKVYKRKGKLLRREAEKRLNIRIGVMSYPKYLKKQEIIEEGMAESRRRIRENRERRLALFNK